MPTSDSRGFTLIELMITIFIAAVLLAMAVPSFRQTIASNRLAAQSNELVGALNYARSEAITRNARVHFCRATSEASTVCGGATANWAAWIVRNNSTGEVMRRGVINPVGNELIVRSTLPADTLVFTPDGLSRLNTLALITNQQITVCSRVREIGENWRNFQLGSTSRLSVARVSADCP